MTLFVASNAVSDQESSCAREMKKGYSSLASKECPFPGSGIGGDGKELKYRRENFVFVISAPNALDGAATFATNLFRSALV